MHANSRLISLVVGVIAVLFGLTLALLGIGATAPILAVLAAIVPQVISIIAVGLLIKLLQLQAVPRRLPAGIGLVPSYPEPANGERRPTADSLSAPSAAGQQLQPTVNCNQHGTRIQLHPQPGVRQSMWRRGPSDRLGTRGTDRAVATHLRPHANQRVDAGWPAWRSGRPVDGTVARRTIDGTDARRTDTWSTRGSRG